MTRHEYLDRILPSATEIPLLPRSVLHIVRMTEKPLCSAADLATMIEADANLTAQVMTLANLPFHDLCQKVTDVSTAVTLLGFSTSKYALLSAAAFEMFRAGGAYFNMPALWKHSVGTATAAKLLAKRVQFPNAEKAFTAGLLHDIGKVVIARYLPRSLPAIVKIMHERQLSMYDAEQMAVGMAHPSFGAWVMTKWGLSEVLVEAVEYHHHPTRSPFAFDLAGIVYLSSIITHRCNIGNGGDTLMREADPLVLEYFDLNERDLIELQDILRTKRLEIDSFATIATAV